MKRHIYLILLHLILAVNLVQGSIYEAFENEIKVFSLAIKQLKANQETPADLRFDLFKILMEKHDKPEQAQYKIIRKVFDHDLEFLCQTLKIEWQDKHRANLYLEKIDEFLSKIQINNTLSFQEHAFYTFCLSCIISNIELNQIQHEYEKQLETMVKVTVHPQGQWSIKAELENQNYAKYIFHISGDGLASIDLINRMTSHQVASTNHFWPVRLIGIACNEIVGFDGVENTGSLRVARHDFIHAGFLKRAFMNNPTEYWQTTKKIGSMWNQIEQDQQLSTNSDLKAKVWAAWFMWTHELTTSAFVDGWPRKLPTAKWYLKGKYSSSPQILLKIAAKIGYIPELFNNEIKTEQNILKHLGLNLKNSESTQTSKNDQVKEIIELLSPGYEYLYTKFNSFYGSQSKFSVFTNRLKGIK